LFLNKIDLFRKKIASGKSPIQKWFPEYRPPENADIKQQILHGQAYFEKMFRDYVRTAPGQKPKPVYVHYTNATDTDLLRNTMKDVQDTIVQRNLNDLILDGDRR